MSPGIDGDRLTRVEASLEAMNMRIGELVEEIREDRKQFEPRLRRIEDQMLVLRVLAGVATVVSPTAAAALTSFLG